MQRTAFSNVLGSLNMQRAALSSMLSDPERPSGSEEVSTGRFVDTVERFRWSAELATQRNPAEPSGSYSEPGSSKLAFLCIWLLMD